MILTPVRRLVLAAVLFVGWLSWLAYLAFTAATPVVLSRPQFLVCDWIAIADLAQVNPPGGKVKVPAPIWSRDPKEKGPEEEITVTNLGQVREQDWKGPGPYILPLVKDGDNYRIVAIPRSPGYEPMVHEHGVRIYPSDKETMHQLEEIRREVLPGQGP